ncbi:MAG: hypothetical protein ACYTE3_18415 [Planctomycetota bacterium]|jgi:hypothetical protein
MNKSLTTWALAAAIFGAAGTTSAMPTLFGRSGIRDLPNWVDRMPRSGTALSRLWIGPDDDAAGDGQFPAWERALRPASVSDSDPFNELLTDFVDSRGFDSPPAEFPDELSSGMFGLPYNTATATVRSLLASDNGIGTQLGRTWLITSNPDAHNYGMAWEDIGILDDTGHVDVVAQDDAVDLIFPVSVILLAGITAGFVGWLGTRRILPPPHMSDM